ncbi:hypothetical protein EMCRGX_G013345 [Ephydatia muelleri]
MLLKKPLGEGYIAVVLMKLDDAANISSVLLSEEAYNVQQNLTAPSQNVTCLEGVKEMQKEYDCCSPCNRKGSYHLCEQDEKTQELKECQ